MSTPDITHATRLLLDSAGDEDTRAAELMALVGKKLHEIASAYLRRERNGHTLQPTALVNEAYLRLIDSTAIQSSDRDRFLGYAARAMRLVLVDHARRRRADKRGGRKWQRVTLHPDLATTGTSDIDLVDLDDLLERFAALDARAARVVELRAFAGLTRIQTADVLGVAPRTVDNDWFTARAWLSRELSARDLD